MKKKWLPVGFILSASLLLAACGQPKEEPKDLALLTFDNAVKADGLNVNSEGKFTIDLSSLKNETQEEFEKTMMDEFKGFDYKVEGAVDVKNKKAEEDISVTVPFKNVKFEFDFAAQLDEKNNKVVFDNDKVLSTVDSLWTIIKSEEKTILASYPEDKDEFDETVTQVDDILAYFKTELKDSYTSYEDEYISEYPVIEEVLEGVKESREVIALIPADKFVYAKDKKGHYGQIVVKLSDKEVKDLIKKEIEKSNEPEKDATAEEIEQNNEWKEQELKSFEEEAKNITFKDVTFALLVDENKYPVSFDVNVKAEVKNPDFYEGVAPFELKSSTTFSHFNKPSFNLPKKGKKVITVDELYSLFDQKYAEWEAKQQAKYEKSLAE